VTPPGLGARRWNGGASVPTTGWTRLRASWPAGELTLTGDEVRLRVRWLGRLFHADTLIARPGDVVWVSQFVAAMAMRGVAFKVPNGREFYFLTGRIEEILAALVDAGFPVKSAVYSKTRIWSGAP
jgi:hypothetical protein